jgi:hypothetical protein
MSSVKRTPTETLMAAMQAFADAEAKECIVIWSDEDGDICWYSSTDSQVLKLGLVEFVSTTLKWQVIDSREGR